MSKSIYELVWVKESHEAIKLEVWLPCIGGGTKVFKFAQRHTKMGRVTTS